MTSPVLPPRSTSLIVFESIASVALIVLSLIGNVLILTALYRNPRLRNTTNFYVAALAVTDILNAAIPGTLFASTIITGRLVYGIPGCRLSGFLVHFLTYVSMATMALTALNRYFRVVKPHLYKKLFGGKRSFFIIAVSWFLIAAFVLYPTVFGLGQFMFKPSHSWCAYTFTSKTAERVFTLIVACVLVVFCVSLIIVCYYQVSKAIRHHNAEVSLSLQGVSAHEIKLSKVLFITAFAFAICWLSTFGVIVIIRVILLKAPHSLAVLIPFLLQAASVLNPIIYGALSPPFRREFRRLMTFKKASLSNGSPPVRIDRGVPLQQISIHRSPPADPLCLERNEQDGPPHKKKIAWAV